MVKSTAKYDFADTVIIYLESFSVASLTKI